MAITIISVILVLIGIGFLMWDRKRDYIVGGLTVLGIVGVVIGGAALFCNLIIWPLALMDSKVIHAQLTSQQKQLTVMLETETADSDWLKLLVTSYNNSVIEVHTKRDTFIVKDYYSSKLDWESLQPIYWD